jgi:hypothetical protein
MKGIFVALGCIACLVHAQEPLPCNGGKRLACETAHRALLAARSAIHEALRQNALWTTAQAALQEAEIAFAAGDFEGAARSSESAQQLAKLGLAQTRYPPLPSPAERE